MTAYEDALTRILDDKIPVMRVLTDGKRYGLEVTSYPITVANAPYAFHPDARVRASLGVGLLHYSEDS